MNAKSNNNEILSQFKSLYGKENFEDALDLLKGSIGKFDDGVYHYNMGIVNLKLDKLPIARYHFEKSRKEGFYSPELERALALTKFELRVTNLEESSTPVDYINDVTLNIPMQAYITISAIFILFFVLFYSKIVSKILKSFLVVLSLFPIVFYFVYPAKYNSQIAVDNLIIYSGPSKIFEQIQEVPEGMKVFTGEDFNGWKYIIHPDSHRGWVTTSKLEML